MTSDDLNDVPRHACGRFAGGDRCPCPLCADIAGGTSREDATRKLREREADRRADFCWHVGTPDPPEPTALTLEPEATS